MFAFIFFSRNYSTVPLKNKEMSWFTSGLETLSQLSEKVQKAIPVVDKEFLAKLTLNTEEMKAERQQFGEEAKRKEQVKNMLAGMLPWETRDTERDILVEECKEAILALSDKEETFFGPYEMPQLSVILDEETRTKKESEDGEEEEVLDEEEERAEAITQKTTLTPSEESLEKLAKLEPLPPLLRDFDLDSHVGLIQRLLKEDPKLERQQSTLSGKLSCIFLVFLCGFLLFVWLTTISIFRSWYEFARWGNKRKSVLAQLLFSLCLYSI